MTRRLAPWLIASLTMAGASFLTFFQGMLHAPFEFIDRQFSLYWLLASFGLAIAWLLTLILGLCYLRWRGLWLLTGLPGVGFWLFLIWIVVSLYSGA